MPASSPGEDLISFPWLPPLTPLSYGCSTLTDKTLSLAFLHSTRARREVFPYPVPDLPNPHACAEPRGGYAFFTPARFSIHYMYAPLHHGHPQLAGGNRDSVLRYLFVRTVPASACVQIPNAATSLFQLENPPSS